MTKPTLLDELTVYDLGNAIFKALPKESAFSALDCENCARVLKAAPDLLQNLKDMVKVWENGWKVDRDVYIRCANAAITKAEGC